jgi:hypothetical protein
MFERAKAVHALDSPSTVMMMMMMMMIIIIIIIIIPLFKCLPTASGL